VSQGGPCRGAHPPPGGVERAAQREGGRGGREPDGLKASQQLEQMGEEGGAKRNQKRRREPAQDVARVLEPGHLWKATLTPIVRQV
jgi:hypothetical protein